MTRNPTSSDTRPAAPGRISGAAPDNAKEGAAFWRFSLALYAQPGAADALLALQDRADLDANLILFGLWIGTRHGCELGPDGFAAAAASVAGLNRIVRDIRTLRRQLGGAADSDTRRLRRALLRLELTAERQVQRRLAARFGAGFAAGTRPPGPGEQRGAALANLARALGGESDSPEAAMLRRALAGLTRRL